MFPLNPGDQIGFAHGYGGTPARVNNLVGLATAVHGLKLNVSQKTTLDHGPFDMVFSGITGAIPPPPVPLVISAIGSGPLPVIPPLIGEQIFLMSDAPACGSLYYSEKLLSQTDATGGGQQNIGAGDANLGAGNL